MLAVVSIDVAGAEIADEFAKFAALLLGCDHRVVRTCGAQLLNEHGTERGGLCARLCRAHVLRTSRGNRIFRQGESVPLLSASAGALEVDAERIAAPAEQRQPSTRRLLMSSEPH